MLSLSIFITRTLELKEVDIYTNSSDWILIFVNNQSHPPIYWNLTDSISNPNRTIVQSWGLETSTSDDLLDHNDGLDYGMEVLT